MFLSKIALLVSLISVFFLDMSRALSCILTASVALVIELYFSSPSSSTLDKIGECSSEDCEMTEEEKEEIANMVPDDDDDNAFADAMMQKYAKGADGEWQPAQNSGNAAVSAATDGKKKVTLQQVRDDYLACLKHMWEHDETEFCQRWRAATAIQRETVVSMLAVNLSKGAQPSGFSIPEKKHQLLVPELSPEKIERMGRKPVKFENLLEKTLKANAEIDCEFVRRHSSSLKSLSLKTGASLYHEVLFFCTSILKAS